ncbi:MAG: hypothetical protein MUC29_10280, partial [Pyrinomonadaceae bacterium]|nr:hypothetical protein [Pyrinomonadaceae bacterium]
FEDNSFANVGISEKYSTADGEIVVQRPAGVLLKLQAPAVKLDIARMASNGEKFCAAVVTSFIDEKFRKFVCGSNNVDYGDLQKGIESTETVKNQNVNAFANVRPQHFTEALLVRPTDSKKMYVQSTIFQVEEESTQPKNSPLRKVLRGYYLLDEMEKVGDNDLKVVRRFWFDRVGVVRLARQQIFDKKLELETDIIYGNTGNLGTNGDYNNFPLRIQVTRPKDKYTMSLTYQSPQSVMLDKTFPDKAFVLENTEGLEEVDLDAKLKEFNQNNKK